MNTTTKKTITKELSFYKEERFWYADLPEYLEKGLGKKANLLMVDGSDQFLDMLSNNGNRVTVKLSTLPFIEHSIELNKLRIGMDKDVLEKVGHAPVDYGAYYNVSLYNNKPFAHTLWLCPVTEYVFEGSYPENIFIQYIR